MTEEFDESQGQEVADFGAEHASRGFFFFNGELYVEHGTAAFWLTENFLAAGYGKGEFHDEPFSNYMDKLKNAVAQGHITRVFEVRGGKPDKVRGGLIEERIRKMEYFYLAGDIKQWAEDEDMLKLSLSFEDACVEEHEKEDFVAFVESIQQVATTPETTFLPPVSDKGLNRTIIPFEEGLRLRRDDINDIWFYEDELIDCSSLLVLWCGRYFDRDEHQKLSDGLAELAEAGEVRIYDINYACFMSPSELCKGFTFTGEKISRRDAEKARVCLGVSLHGTEFVDWHGELFISVYGAAVRMAWAAYPDKVGTKDIGNEVWIGLEIRHRFDDLEKAIEYGELYQYNPDTGGKCGYARAEDYSLLSLSALNEWLSKNAPKIRIKPDQAKPPKSTPVVQALAHAPDAQSEIIQQPGTAPAAQEAQVDGISEQRAARNANWQKLVDDCRKWDEEKGSCGSRVSHSRACRQVAMKLGVDEGTLRNQTVNRTPRPRKK